MHFSKQIALCLAIGFATASPIAEKTTRELDDIVNPLKPHLSLEQQCVYRYYMKAVYEWNVVVSKADEYTDDECGSGFLDNINGRGCAITSWGCNYADDGSTMNANFASDLGCSATDISSAINAAFGGVDVDCLDYDKET